MAIGVVGELLLSFRASMVQARADFLASLLYDNRMTTVSLVSGYRLSDTARLSVLRLNQPCPSVTSLGIDASACPRYSGAILNS